MSGVPEWLTSTFERPNETPPETEPAREEKITSPGLIEGDKNQEASAFVSLTTQKPEQEKAKAAKADMRIKGEFATPLPEDIQDERQEIRAKELNFAEAQSFTRMNAGRALAQTKAMAQEIFAEDANEMERLNRDHYARWEKENEQFRADIDSARALRVNPNNYMQRVGRSGRVSSVLSVAVSQLAAGAGNPNQVWNRIKSTIDQDILAQKANIELEFAGIEAAQGQQDREVEMLEKYYGFEEKSRAVAMAALEAQVGVIMQRASNEGEYQAYQMIRDRARAEQIDAAAQALAKNATLFLDAPTHRAYQVLLKSRQWKEAQAMLQAANTGALGGAQDVDTSVQSYDQYGQPVTFSDPETVPAEAPQSPVEAAPTPGAARVAKRRPSRETPASPEEQVVTETAPVAEQTPLTPEQAQAEQTDIEGITWPAPQLTPDEQKEADAKREAEDKHLRARAAAVEVDKGIRQRMGEDVMRQGGYRYEQEIAKGQTAARLRGQGLIPFTEARDIIIDPSNPEIAVFPSHADAREGLKYDTRTGAKANYERNNPELYEARVEIEHEGTKTKPRWVEANFVTTAWGDLVLKRGSHMRSDQEARLEFQGKVNTDFRRASDIYAQAKAVTTHGASSFMGLQIGENGLEWPGSPEAMKSLQEKNSGRIGLAIQAMKLLDPSGRLTDQDIIVGKEYVLAILENPGVAAFEAMSSIYRRVTGQDPTKSDVRRALNKTLKAMATKLGEAVALDHIGQYVLSYEQDQKFQADRAEVSKWLRSEDK